MFFPDEVRDEGRKQLQDNNIDHELRIYPGVPHGMLPRWDWGGVADLI